MSKFESLKEDFTKALRRLEENLKEQKTEIVRDSAIKRFEFTFDLSWKLIKAYLEENKGVVCVSPKGCFREAYRQGLLAYDDFWIEMTDMRNDAAHTYRESLAEEIYGRLPRALDHFNNLSAAFASKIE